LAIEKLAYGGWDNCYRLTDGTVELIVTTDVGPRIIRCGFAGSQNLFWENSHQMGKSGEAYWQMRGGHRLWVAPELVPVTYALDNGPVEAHALESSIALIQRASIEKEMIITLRGGVVEVLHKLRNCTEEAMQLSPWAVSVMAQGGLGIAAFPERATHDENLLPTNPLVMWAYTDFSDKRWSFTQQYLMLRQDIAISRPQKAGLFNRDTFAAYLLGTELFTKRCSATPEAVYPDFNSSLEIFTNNDFLELETLGPLVTLEPGEAATHTEHWSLHRDIQLEDLTDSELGRVLGPLMK
jgi:hypothetical protein